MIIFIDLIIGILLGVVLIVPVILVWQWNRLKPAFISLPILVEATNLAVLIGGLGMIATALTGIVYLMFPQDDGFMIGLEMPLWKIVLLYTLIFLLPPQLMWFKPIRKSTLGVILIAIVWAAVVIQGIELKNISPYTILGLFCFWLIVVWIYLNRMKRINSGA